MHCVPVFTKHFAERVISRCSNMENLHLLKRKIRRHFCEYVYECLLTENKTIKVKYKNSNAVVYFCETSKKLYVKTYYEKD